MLSEVDGHAPPADGHLELAGCSSAHDARVTRKEQRSARLVAANEHQARAVSSNAGVPGGDRVLLLAR